MMVEGQAVTSGDLIRIDGINKAKFIFLKHVINTETGVEWVDTIHLMRGEDGPFRSFRPERVRLYRRRNGKNRKRKSD